MQSMRGRGIWRSCGPRKQNRAPWVQRAYASCSRAPLPSELEFILSGRRIKVDEKFKLSDMQHGGEARVVLEIYTGLEGGCMDRLSKACLFLISALLAVISLRPVLAPRSVEAAQHYKYMVATVRSGHEAGKPCPDCAAQGLLDKYAADGWELVTVANGQFIFRK